MKSLNATSREFCSAEKRKPKIYTMCRSHYIGSWKQACPDGGATHLALSVGG
jgi:hypothetical protein